jgi:two-component sensor histidine kinase
MNNTQEIKEKDNILESPKVLLVDDNREHLELIVTQFRRLLPGALILKANSGQQGLEMARLKEPDVILLDMLMPGMDGFELCRRLRAHETTRYIPVIMLTAAKTDPAKRVEALNSGADVFLSKPVEGAELVAQAHAMLRLKRAEDKIGEGKKNLHEKELLLRESHHRIKNNLATISSLLNLQSGYIEDETIKEAFKESRKRIQSIAMIHEKLHGSLDLSRIEFGQYIKDLAEALTRSYATPVRRVNLNVNTDDLFFDVDTSVPLGLIVTELVTNALKYGHHEGEMLNLSISLTKLAREDSVQLEVTDNGPGIPGDLDWRNTNTLGLQLVIMLVEQLEGAVELVNNGGAMFRVTFHGPPQRKKERE